MTRAYNECRPRGILLVPGGSSVTHNRVPTVGSGGPTDGKPSEPSWFLRLLDRLPPLIQALTPLIIFLVGFLVGGAGSVAIGHATTPAPQPTATVTVTATAPPLSSTPTSAPASTGAPLSIYWGPGPVGITPNGLNFDTKPPSSTPSGTIYYNTGLYGGLEPSTANIELAVWPYSSAPTAAECQTWATTHPSSKVGNVTPGMQICIRTDQGRFGLLHIDSIDSNNSGVEATATIWEA